MRQIIGKIASSLMQGEENQRIARNYYDLMQQPGWEVHKNYLLLIKGMMAEELLSSRRFSELDMTQKDIAQRTYYNVNLLIEFLLDPLAQSRRLWGMESKIKAKGSKKRTVA